MHWPEAEGKQPLTQEVLHGARLSRRSKLPLLALLVIEGTQSTSIDWAGNRVNSSCVRVTRPRQWKIAAATVQSCRVDLP